jgi:hypothetical protein
MPTPTNCWLFFGMFSWMMIVLVQWRSLWFCFGWKSKCLQLILLWKWRGCNSRNIAANTVWQPFVVNAFTSRQVSSVSALGDPSFLRCETVDSGFLPFPSKTLAKLSYSWLAVMIWTSQNQSMDCNVWLLTFFEVSDWIMLLMQLELDEFQKLFKNLTNLRGIASGSLLSSLPSQYCCTQADSWCQTMEKRSLNEFNNFNHNKFSHHSVLGKFCTKFNRNSRTN